MFGGAAQDEGKTAPAIYESMVLDKQKYLCRIPVVKTSLAQNASTEATERTAEEEKKELMRASDRGWELLQGMQGNCIYFHSGWWSYSFCYDNEIKQFHQLPQGRGAPPSYPPVEDTQVQSYVLGKFAGARKKKKKQKTAGAPAIGSGDKDGTPSEEKKGKKREWEVAKLETKGETRYLVQRLGGGTICDLTGKERKIEIQVKAHPRYQNVVLD